MSIIEEYNEQEGQIIHVTKAVYEGDFRIRVSFEDGKEQLVDFKGFLERSLHPSIRKYLDEECFRQFEIIDGNLNWNDYGLIFPVADLYEGKV